MIVVSALSVVSDGLGNHAPIARLRLPVSQMPSNSSRSIDAAFIVTLWRLTFNAAGGKHDSYSIRDEGTVEWIAYVVRKAAEEGAPSWDTAGLALHRVVTTQPFMDCNHRTGWLLCRTLMLVDGYELAIPGDEVVSYVKSIDQEELDEQRVKEWVRAAFFRLA
jgi:prophage maintenance system killer protein